MAGYKILQSYIGFLACTSHVPLLGQELANNKSLPEDYFSAPYDDDLNIIRGIVEVAVRDATDRNLEGEFLHYCIIQY